MLRVRVLRNLGDVWCYRGLVVTRRLRAGRSVGHLGLLPRFIGLSFLLWRSRSSFIFLCRDVGWRFNHRSGFIGRDINRRLYDIA